MPKVIKITLSKSLIAAVPKNVKTCHALGLRKVGQWTYNNPSPAVLGMVHQVKHLLTVEEVEIDHEPKTRRRRDPRQAETPQVVESTAKPKRIAKKKTEEESK